MENSMRIWFAPKRVVIGLLSLVGLGFGLLALRPAGTAPATQPIQVVAAKHTLSRNDQQIWDMQERVRTDPQNAQARAILGAAYLQKARETGDPSYYGKADQVLDQALAIAPNQLDALVVKGTLSLARHQFREALALGERAKAQAPRLARVYGVIADSQIELGMYPEAVETIQAMADIRPDLSSYSRISYARELHGDLDGAIEAMTMAVAAGGPATENVEWTRVQLGNLLFAKGDLAGAEVQYAHSLERSPKYVYALAGMARVRAAQGQISTATTLYQQAIERMPLPEFVIALGELHEAAGQQKEADQQYQLVQAMQQLFKANGVDTDLELALFEADHGRDPHATVAMARAAYQRRPSIKGADVLGWALYRAGQLTEARSYAEQALRLGTQDAVMLYHAGTIAQAQGDSAAARTWLGQAVALNPAFSPLYGPQAQQALKLLNATAKGT
jgi:tetratricopeptide (TPR) repeat protein